MLSSGETGFQMDTCLHPEALLVRTERVAGLGHTTEQVCGFLFAESQGCWVKGTVLANASRRVGGVSVGKQCSGLHVCGGRKL